MVVHADDKKPFKCPYCILRYSYQSHLKQHIEKNHTIKEDLNHFCIICNIHFNKKSHLNKHNFIHNGEKPFKCYYPFCEKSYFNEGKLNCHIRKDHNLNTNITISNKINDINMRISNNISENISTCFENNDLTKINNCNNIVNCNRNQDKDLSNINNLKDSDYDIIENILVKYLKKKRKKLIINAL